MIYSTLYNRDELGRIRIWRMESDDVDSYRTISGLIDGKQTESGWRKVEQTNIGRANERSLVAQLDSTIQSAYTYQLKRTYHESIDTVDEPKFFEPMLAQKYKSFKPGFVQPKLDGKRCITDSDGSWSRGGEKSTSCPHINEILEPFFAKYPELMLDGELYAHEYADNFDMIMSLVQKKKADAEHHAKTRNTVVYHVYDLPSHPGKFKERTVVLENLVKEINSPFIKFVETVYIETAEQYDALHGKWLQDGYEGSMWRDPDSLYENTRSKGLQKRKEFQDEEYDFIEWLEGEGNWAGAAKAVRCWLPGTDKSQGWNKNNSFKAGIKGTRDKGKELLKTKPEQVTVKFFQLTPSGIPRFGVAIKFWNERRNG